MKYLKAIVGHLWALPTSVVGLLVVGLSGAKPYRLRPAGCWWWVAERGPWAWFFAKYEKGATTIGAITVCAPDEKDNPTTIRHERRHTWQSWWMGALFIPGYYGACGVAWAEGGDPYANCWFERDAYAHEREPDEWG